MNRGVIQVLTGIAQALRTLETRLSAVEAHILDEDEGDSEMGNQIDRLTQDVTNLQTSEAGAETRVEAVRVSMQAQIDALKAQPPGADISAQLAALEATNARLSALDQPAPVPAPAPTPAADQTPPAAPAPAGQ